MARRANYLDPKAIPLPYQQRSCASKLRPTSPPLLNTLVHSIAHACYPTSHFAYTVLPMRRTSYSDAIPAALHVRRHLPERAPSVARSHLSPFSHSDKPPRDVPEWFAPFPSGVLAPIAQPSAVAASMSIRVFGLMLIPLAIKSKQPHIPGTSVSYYILRSLKPGAEHYAKVQGTFHLPRDI
ncbi:hypothetical protein PYCCODRAFT_649846 [Trametes coccinea BRFM310]|uniref:Uncharacterized protein n=1 Tax=Trametes coccinea (strain BRFM310) TaxID=1353009 RepID=A0A1Y2IJT8_TRAC3|nr:hypothetical protein PYCCODRAFT_649846 [Trametes coccinea BRFM310]